MIHCIWFVEERFNIRACEGLIISQDHCFDYIRQSLMCAGDTTIAGEDFPGGSYQFDVVHVCRNWDQIYNWLDENRASDKWQFGEEELSWVPPD